MLKKVIKTTCDFNYSLNFDLKKRKKNRIKFIIFHYTGMNSEKKAIKKLTNNYSKVSSHYFIKNSGKIIVMVPENYVAWHAGNSLWKSFKSLNNTSIGIEIQNPGHQFNYRNFTKKQIFSIIELSKKLIKKFKIKKNNILGHSDIAPDRKKDPGEKFPWELLAKNKISIWHNINSTKLLKLRNKKIKKREELKFIRNIKKIGYSGKKNALLIQAFQRRFRPKLINRKVDKECFEISKSLLLMGF